ncbi:hypothetical protein SNE40_023168 [Patella caerulea]|uniref:Uncharacterized protein n=1 Tax=Patella caerulea TaxID=87958 RepID=A0AAN8G5S9_PATCE
MAPRAYLWPSLFLGFLLFASETQARARVRRDGTENGRCHAIPGPAHGKVNCGDDIFEYTCTSTCDSGYQFTTRQSSIDRTCDQYSGEWYDGKDFPECVPVCATKCANNGTCIGPNHCKCQNGWKGDYCEHYDPKCLQREGPEFGAIKCQNLDEVLFCQVSCNEGYTFESLPAVQYTCSQDTGWDPPKEVKIPNCIPIPTVGVPVTPGPIYTPFPVAATCVAWSQNHYRTFDNKVYSYDGQCTYELITDCSSFNAFSVHVTNDRHCVPGTQCKKEISIFVGGAQISLKRVNDAAQVKLGDDILNVPSSRDGFVFEQTGRFLTVRTQLGFQLKWDSKESIFVQVEKSMKKKICGLCGLYDGNPLNDFMVGDDIANSVISFAQYYKKAVPGEAVCPDLPQSSGCLTDTPANIAKTQSATTRCSQMNGGKFASCNSVIDPAVYIETCKSDCCKSDTASCMCNSFEAYARDCSRKQIVLDWRTAQTCPISCGNGMIYQECGSSCPKTCADPTATCSDDQCVDSCFCPEGTLYHDGSCFQPNQCPCTHEGKDYKEGEKIPSECNTCTCSSGKWSCTTHNCDKRCAATGDPHYLTFDGTPFDFMGTCSYYLLKDNNFDVIVDNIACGHGEATCTKSITLDYNGLNIKLDHNHELYVNGKAITRLPYEVPGIKIFMVSSLFMQAVLGNGITIFWDGRTRAYITAPPSFMRKTGGLCGFYDGKPTNDFKTPEGNTETNPNIFGNRWKTEASCRDVPSNTTPPCDINPGRKLNATKECGILKNEVFQACHSKVPVDTYIENCMYDTCACQSNFSECLCPNLAEYASQCAVEEINLNWRQKIPECAIKCPANQIYMSCGNPCVRSCRNIALNLDCRATCVEGCTCPSGYTLNDLSECIPISDCYCIFDNREYQPGFTTLIGKDLCQCVNARWSCRTFVTETNTTGGNLPTDVVIQAPCPSNMKYSDCVSRCPQTCFNLHDPPACNSAPCEQGCVCESGFVLESNQENAMCIPNNTCPCFHGGQKYYNGQVIKMDCSNCTCHDRKWLCNEVDCPAYCTSYGNSHYITFDGKPYNFQGNCDFILAKSTEFDRDQFQIITENVPCEGPGVTCSKAIEFTIGEPGTPDFYRLNLVRGKPIMVDSKAPFDITDVGNSVIVNTPGGISLSWDKGTTVYVQLSAEHMGKVTGLCGNFNGNPKDDFKGKLGGPTLSSAITFGDQWKVHDYCKIPSTIVSECEKVPARKPWAEQKCEILKSKVFEPCHSVVDYKPYLERCVFDVCACNMSGECESVCTDVAAYAHECAIKGTPIVWRTQELCYIECVDCEEYNPCITTCPEKTCDNHLHYDEITRECLQEACYEGCHRKPCPPGQVFDSNVEPMKCVSVTECQPACLIDSKKYREGERIFDKSVCNPECEVCTCKNGTLARYGFCSTATVTSTNVVTSSTSPNTGTVTGPTVSHTSPSTFSPICIHSGWTPYMSISTPTPSNTGDIETIDGLRSAYRFCNISMMEAIRCRVIGRDTMYDRSGQKVTCDLKDGLKCLHQDQDGKQLCYDYEVSYLCFCGETTAGITTPTGSGNGTTPTGDTITPTGSVPTPTRTPIPPVCYPGWTTWMDLGSPLINPKGDFELIKDLRYAYGFCMMPTSIRCRSATTHKSYHNTDDKNVQCDLKNGLQCFSDKQDKKICDNYEVSLHCECPSTATHTTSEVTGSSVATTNVIPPNATITTPTPGTPYTPIPSCLWTNWMNSYKKTSTNHGDYDTLSRLRLQFAFCKQPARIECRVAPSRKYPQGISYERAGQMAVTCDLNRGLVCEDFMQGPGEQCYDYEVRFYCIDGCSTPPIVTYVTPPFNPSNVSGQTPGVTPTGGTGKTPTPGTGNPSNVSGQTPGVTPTADTGKTPTPGTGKPSTVSGVTPGVTPTTGGTGQTPKPVCVEGWTPWINTDTPDTGTGDIESVFNIPGYPVTCKTQIGINCRLATSHESYASTGQDVQCDPVEGLACLNTEFQKCMDYEVQFYCLCGSTTPSGTPSPGTPPIDTGSTTLNAGSTTPPIATTTPLNKDCKPGWTTWMNVDKPGGPDGGDIETMDRLRYYNNFCGDKYIVGAKCRVEETGKDSETTGQKMTCDRKTGVTCLDSDQPDSSCKDYSIKFYCDCSVTTPSPPTTESTTDHKITGSTPQGTTIKECEYPMGLEHRSEITDVQFTASSSYDFSTEANQARLNNVAIGRMVGAWMPRFKDDQQWIQIDLLHPKNITGIVTQGRPGHNNWVKSYIVRTSLDGVNFIPITDFGKTSPLIFAGNSDHETPKTQIFAQKISARYVRVYPVTFETSIALRLEILGCFVPAVTGTGTTVTTTQTTASTPVTPPLNCVYPMGVDNNVLIKDYQLSASSYHGASYAANGRLFNPYGGWEPRTNYGYEWIQVDFLQPSFVSGVVTQGSGLNKKWVTKFFVETSVDGIHFLRYTENDRTRMFTGNSDQNSVVKNVFKNSFIARYVRIVPKEWSPYGVGLRFNIIGCLTPNIQTHIPTTPPTLIPVCQIKMGLENYRIVTDSQLTASSQIDKYHGPSSGRLTVVDQSNVSWVPKSTDTNRWIQVDFLERKIITGTIVQGGSENGWVSKYVVYYSNDGIHFTPYTESPLETAPKIFKGNQDGIKPVTNLFNRNIYARYVKLFPKSVHNAGGLKFNVIGCNPSIENNVSTPTTAAIITPEVTPTPYTGSPTPYTGPPTTAPIITPEVTPTPYTGSPTPYTGPPTTAPIITPEVTPTPYTGSPTPYTGPPTTAPTVCMIPMGVESRYVIHSYQLTASSQIDIAHGADQGRIYNTAVNEHGGAWVPLPSDKTPFIQVDFGQPTLVSGIITQGNPDKPMWIQTYKVLGSFDNKEFFPYSNTPGNVEPKTFNGNTDGTTPVQNLFNRNWLTRYIRIVPLDWTKSGASLRFNILGCTRPPTSVTISVPFIPPTIAGQSIPTYSGIVSICFLLHMFW